MFMNVRNKRKIVGLFAFMLFACTVVAQYSVTGGSKAPVQAVNSTPERIEAYLVYGMEDVKLSYTSSSSSHKWYRYRTGANSDSQPVASTLSGTTSTVTNVEDGYGYYVKDEENVGMNRFVWIIDYSKYEFEIRSINILPEIDPCFAIRFGGDADNAELAYNNPNGTKGVVKREFELHYETLEWNGELKMFSRKQVNQLFNSDPFSTTFPLSQKDRFLTDTEITLTGDLFARHFGVEKSISFYYETKMLEVHTDTMTISSGSSNMSDSSDGELHAPAVINFRAYANTPVASRFVWKIYRLEELSGDSTLIQEFPGEETVYTFDRVGKYVAMLEVSDHSGLCSNDEDDKEEREFQISITETEMIIPNAFSPGTTPGINDIFRVRYKSVIRFKGWIFNRWGTEMFHWTDQSQGWDGKYRGKYVPPGAYYYLIEYTGTDGKNRTRKGDINVFRSKNIETEIRAVD